MTERTCLGCRADLAGTNPRRLYCSQACRRWVSNGHKEPRSPATHCVECAASLAGKLASAIYCSRRCKNKVVQRGRVRDDAARYLKERDRRIAYATAYATRNPHVAQVSKRNRKAAKGKVYSSDWLRLCRRFDFRCAYCGAAEPLTMDHVVPLVRGGGNTIGNILPACRSCNCRKQGRFLIEWRTGRSRQTGRT